MNTPMLEIACEVARHTYAGAFLVSNRNVMTIGWCSAGVMWNKPIFMAPVRISRKTNSILERYSEFVICLPFAGEMEDELEYCGTKSGRDVNKIKDLEFNMINSDKVSIKKIDGCEYYLECKVLSSAGMELEKTDKSIKSRFYSSGDEHTLFLAEILTAKKIEKSI